MLWRPRQGPGSAGAAPPPTRHLLLHQRGAVGESSKAGPASAGCARLARGAVGEGRNAGRAYEVLPLTHTAVEEATTLHRQAPDPRATASKLPFSKDPSSGGALQHCQPIDRPLRVATWHRAFQLAQQDDVEGTCQGRVVRVGTLVGDRPRRFKLGDRAWEDGKQVPLLLVAGQVLLVCGFEILNELKSIRAARCLQALVVEAWLCRDQDRDEISKRLLRRLEQSNAHHPESQDVHLEAGKGKQQPCRKGQATALPEI